MGKLFKAVAFVTIFSVLTRALGFLLRIYLSRVLGAEILGTYQIAMSIFGVILTLVASGLPTIISRQVAFMRGNGQTSNSYKVVNSGLIVALITSCVVSAFIFFFPNAISALTNEQSSHLILLLLPAVIASSVYAILRGALWGQKKFFAISFSEFFEQVVRIIILFILVSLPLNIGLGERAALSLSLACIASALLVVAMYFGFGGKLKSPKNTFKPLLKTSMPITAVRTASNLVSSAIAIIIPARLMLYGFSASEAMAQFGIMMGMTFPLLMIPSTFIGSIAVAIIPEISEQTTNIDKQIKDPTVLKNQINLSISLSIIISCLMLPVYLVLGKPIGMFLFNNETAGVYLARAAVLMIPLGLNQITGSILNAIGLELKSLKNYAMGAIVLFVCIYFLPKFIGVWAVILGMAGLSLTTSTLNIIMLAKRKMINAQIFKVLLIMLALSVPTMALGTHCFNIFNGRIPLVLSLAFGAIITESALILLVLCTNLANIKGFLFRKFKQKSGVKKCPPQIKQAISD